MVKPCLQLALDLTDFSKALEISEQTKNIVDIIEVGTILVIDSGLESVRKIRALAPETQLLADIRIIKAGGKLASMTYGAGADFVTIISDASKETFEAVVAEKKKNPNRNIMIEVNTSYDEKQLNYWLELGLEHIIFHRGSEITDSHDSWTDSHFREIRRLTDLGFKVYVTGGIGLTEIERFHNVPVYGFIIGRAISHADNPGKEAKKYQDEIAKWFGD